MSRRSINFGGNRLERLAAYAKALEVEGNVVVCMALDEYMRNHPAPLEHPTRTPAAPHAHPAGAVHPERTPEAPLEHPTRTAPVQEGPPPSPPPLALSPPTSPSHLSLSLDPPSEDSGSPPISSGGKATSKGKSEATAEVQWRRAEVWRAHLRARAKFWKQEDVGEPQPPQLTYEVSEAIDAALREHDGQWLGPLLREEWAKRSAARAAGIGIFLDPWCTGRSRDNDVKTGGKRYLEGWRPWKRQRGKPDPVSAFSQLYWEKKNALGR